MLLLSQSQCIVILSWFYNFASKLKHDNYPNAQTCKKGSRMLPCIRNCPSSLVCKHAQDEEILTWSSCFMPKYFVISVLHQIRLGASNSLTVIIISVTITATTMKFSSVPSDSRDAWLSVFQIYSTPTKCTLSYPHFLFKILAADSIALLL